MNKLVLTLGIATALVGGLTACGGGGGSNANLCTVPADCTDTALPYCVAGVCHACESPTNCNAAAPVCEADVFECGGCVNDASCGAYPATSHCAPSGACVGCITSDQCSGPTPVCDTGPGTCRACTLDSECASGACNLESGACIAEASVLYAAPTGTPNTMCTRAMPCTVKQALSIVNTAKSTVVLADGDYTVNAGTEALLAGAKSALVVGAPAAKFVAAVAQTSAIRVTTKAAATLRGFSFYRSGVTCNDAVVRIRNLKFDLGGTSSTNCQTTVVASLFVESTLAADGPQQSGTTSTLLVDQTTFRREGDNTSLQLQGATASTIVNSLFYNPVSCAGSDCIQIRLTQSPAGSCVFAYNTIVEANTFSLNATTMKHNLFFTPGQTPYTGTFENNFMVPLPTGLPASNITGDPQFVNAAAGDFHLMPGSPAIDKGPATVPTGLPTKDLDGNARLVGPATDMGAFEFHP